jgi:predicted dehydrogenase
MREASTVTVRAGPAPVRVALIGTGNMARHHLLGYRAIPGVEVVACCDRRKLVAEGFAAEHGIPRLYTDYRELLAREELDAVDNITPDARHAEVAIAAAQRGLHVMSEKPLATSVAEGEAMVAAVEEAGVINMVNFTYRNAPALQAGAAIVAAGRLGVLRHVECSYLQSWLVANYWGDWRTSEGWLWRLSRAHCGSGVLGDLGCHLYDAVQFLAGPIARLHCTLRTYDKGIPGDRVGEYVFDANDSFVAMLEFAHGALGMAHSSRWATGHQNSLRFKVHGEAGALEIDLDRSTTHYRLCLGDELHRARWEEHEAPSTPDNYARFIAAIRTGEPPPSDFANALRVQRCLARSEESDRSGGWVDVAGA